jgi:hypothetical protein
VDVCSNCFRDEGLRLTAASLGVEDDTRCPGCGSTLGRKLDEKQLARLASSFFVHGTLHRTQYGGAPLVQFNEHRKTSIRSSAWLESDIRIFEEKLGIGFFRYGPRLCMVGEVEPLKALQEPNTRQQVISRILREYPQVTIAPDQAFYRLRLKPSDAANPAEYDSPPTGITGRGRLDSGRCSIMYASPDLETCVHECRAAAEDEIFVATLVPTRPLVLLDLTEVLHEEGVTEFESLDLAIHMLFLAADHSYDITRAITVAAQSAGHDGIFYPSYFSLLRTGAIPFQTSYGLLHRRIPQFAVNEKAKMVPNIGLFGRPIQDGRVRVRSINRVFMRRVDYKLTFGPVEIN